MSGAQHDLLGGDERFFDVAPGARRTLDEHIAACVAFRDAHAGSGAWPVQKYLAGARRQAGAVELAHVKVVRMKGMCRSVAIPQFWQAAHDDESLKGPAVVRLT